MMVLVGSQAVFGERAMLPLLTLPYFPCLTLREMASSGIYKLDNGKPYLNNCFPAKNLLRMPEEGRGHWLVARKCNLKKKPKNVLEAPAEGQESQKKVSFEVRGKKGSLHEKQEDVPGHILDQAFLLKHYCVRKPSDLCNINVSGLKFSKIAKEDAILPVALFPSLCELIFHNNPLVAHTRGVPPLLKTFLQEHLGIHLIRRKIVKAKHHILMPRKDSRKVKTQVPKVPKQPLILHHLSVPTIKSPSKEMPESEAAPTKELSTTRSSPLEPEMPIEGLEGLSLSHRPFVPLPPICSDSTVHSEETMSHQSNRPGHLSPEHLSDEDTKSTESIFLTQVSGLPSSIHQKDDSAVKEEEQRPPRTAPREVKRAWRKLPSASLPSKYRGYEELLTAKPDPAFIEPKGIQKNTQALQYVLKHPLLFRSSKPRLDTLQKRYVPKEKRAQRIPIPPPRKTRAQLLDDILIRMRDPRNITEAPLGAVLRQRTEQRLVNQKQYLEAKRLLKEFRARYRQLVRCSLRTVFRATAPPPGHPALSEGQPRFGRFLKFMDEFCQGPTASDSKD
uniref:X-ray radiation resistance associated 1 n=1 Tax=Felis catus TaxID=9685 RepID=A0ABI7Z7F8_FELCA